MYRDEKHDSNQTPLPQHTSGEGGQPLYLPWQTAHQPTNRTSRPARSFASIPEDSQRSLVDFNGTTSEGSPEDEKVTLLAEV